MPEWFNEFQEFFLWTFRLVLFLGTAGLLAVSLVLAVISVLEPILSRPKQPPTPPTEGG